MIITAVLLRYQGCHVFRENPGVYLKINCEGWRMSSYPDQLKSSALYPSHALCDACLFLQILVVNRLCNEKASYLMTHMYKDLT